ncbi:inositol monophosphatase family protein [Planococcus lenghuensis]|uniref:inositol-phosphate phosphatase n=1 Tax=Planococcus lenghuensis TaxID=2213202 RepID=A0A1Q2L063_9BACL|nr:inositol monophosphatase family protein [Planococcus lenghuensis]AQQ53839.1 inositol monophosphatase [Planococcus lenghuensis]
MDFSSIDKYAKSLIKEAGHRIRNSFVQDIQVETKADANDLVTNIDKEIEQFFIGRIKNDFPDHRIFGEEGFGDPVEDLSGIIWILDPIDGTMNFVHQKRNFAISLGIYQEGTGVLGYIYDVVNDDLYSAQQGKGAYLNDERLPDLTETAISEAMVGINSTWLTPNRYIDHEAVIQLIRDIRGARSYGAASLEIAYVASGRLDAYVSMRLSPWDIAGGLVIALETGAVASNFHGDSANLLQSDSFLIANPSIHPLLLDRYIKLK